MSPPTTKGTPYIMANVSPQDVLSRWMGGDAPSATDETLLVFIEDALTEVHLAQPELDARLASGAEPHLNSLIKRVVAGAVIRAWKVGYEYRLSFSEAMGGVSHGGSFGPEERRGVYLTDEEKARLNPPEEAVGTAFTFSMWDALPSGPAPAYYGTEWRPL